MASERPSEFDHAASGFDLVAGWELHLESEPPARAPTPAQRPSPAGPPERPTPRMPSEAMDWSVTPAQDQPPATDFSVHVVSRDVDGGPDLGFGHPNSGHRPDYPAAGQVVAGFRIVRELGRGAFARVYLAKQECLSNREVALKVARGSIGDESSHLARLQHSHIVPVLSVHEEADWGWSLLCMPYLGGGNLAQVIQATRVQAKGEAWRGADLIRALDQLAVRSEPDPKPAASGPAADSRANTALQESVRLRSRSRGRSALASESAESSTSRSLFDRALSRVPHWPRGSSVVEPPTSVMADRQPARQFLMHAGGIQSSVWIAARLSEGLDHAHSRGLLHRDVKPSNVLITAEGTPMLLDFNLSAEAEILDGAGSAREKLGGTLPYMAPEHLDAFNPRGRTRPEAVDGRSDLYSLGLILYEMVVGQPPFKDPPPGLGATEQLSRMTKERQDVPSPRAKNPEIPWSLESIIRHALEPDPDRRYQTAGHLAEDLQRFLDDEPLAYARELSWRERVAKFGRRNPKLVASTNIGLVASVLLLVLASSFWIAGQKLLAARALIRQDEFRDRFEHCQFLLNTTTGPRDHLDEGIKQADELLESFGVSKTGGDWLRSPEVMTLPEDRRIALRERLSELILLLARASVTRVERRDEAARRNALIDAIAWLDRAESMDPHPPGTLFADRSRYYSALGLEADAAKDAKRAAETVPKSARDFQLRGTSLLSRGRSDAAEVCLARATAMDAEQVWAWFALGFCHSDQGRWSDAAADFAFCTVLLPEFAWSHYNRAQALQRSNRLVDARLSFDKAVRLDPTLLEARYSRAMVELELGDPRAALNDLDKVISKGWSDTEVLVARAEALSRLGKSEQAELEFDEALLARPEDPRILVARGFSRLVRDPSGAATDLESALRLSPDDARAHLGLAHLSVGSDPRAALGHLDAALEDEPGQSDALQFRAVVRGRLGMRSARDDVAALELVPTPLRLYNAACAMAWLQSATNDEELVPEVLRLLRRAIEMGFPTSGIENDPAFATLRVRPEFTRALRPSG